VRTGLRRAGQPPATVPRFDPEPLTPLTPRPLRRVALTQTWSGVTFLHWAADPALVAPLLPAGTAPDVIGGVTYVGLISFFMRGAGLGRGPGVPHFGDFPETNVRLYSVDPRGRRGVVFLSLEISRLATVVAARRVGVPYMWASMRVTKAGDVWTYRTVRRWPRPAGVHSLAIVRAGAPIARPSELDHFLTDRWGLHLRLGRRTCYWPNEHPRWPLHSAELLGLDDDLMASAGLPGFTRPPDSVLWSPGVHARFGVPSPITEVR
jgi:uncharacterized protein YqjF (DUF2071 family)